MFTDLKLSVFGQSSVKRLFRVTAHDERPTGPVFEFVSPSYINVFKVRVLSDLPITGSDRNGTVASQVLSRACLAQFAFELGSRLLHQLVWFRSQFDLSRFEPSRTIRNFAF